MAAGPARTTPFRDPITKKVLTPEPSYPAGQGKIRKSSEDIGAKVEREQRRQSNGSN